MFLSTRFATFLVAALDATTDERQEADYICDGVADDATIEEAIADLPSSGGSVVLSTGTFELDGVVDYAKDNVHIYGQGRNTLLNRDASSAVISAGSRTGWLIENLRTDGGTVDVTSATASAKIFIWEGATFVSQVLSGGDIDLSGSSLLGVLNILPETAGTGDIGSTALPFDDIYVDNAFHVLTAADANDKAELDSDSLSFGAGGASALDTILTRTTTRTLRITSTGATVVEIKNSGDTSEWLEFSDYAINIGDGTAAPDHLINLDGAGAFRFRVPTADSPAIELYDGSDTAPKAKLGETGMSVGPGGASAVDTTLLRTAAATLSLTTHLIPASAGAGDIGSLTAPFNSMTVDNVFQVATAADANAKAELDSNSLSFGAGGASALDTVLARQSASVLRVTATDNAPRLEFYTASRLIELGWNATVGRGAVLLDVDNATTLIYAQPGSATQSTNFTTTVTSDFVAGQITTHDTGAPAAGAEATFAVTSPVLTANSVILLSVQSSTAGTPLPFVSSVAANSFSITVTNLHAADAVTGLVINYVIIDAHLTL